MTRNVELDLTLVIPCHNEERNLIKLLQDVDDICRDMNVFKEVILVDDGSRDNSLALIEELKKKYTYLKSYSLKENRGQQYAITVGIKKGEGRYAIVMDADLQHPAILIKKLYYEMMDTNVDMIQTIRMNETDLGIKKITSKYYYKMLNFIFKVPIRMGAADCRIISSQIIDDIKKQNRMNIVHRIYCLNSRYKILFMPIKINERHSGVSSYSMIKQIKLFFNSIREIFYLKINK